MSQPKDGRTHPYCRPTKPGEFPTIDRLSVESCRGDTEVLTLTSERVYVPREDVVLLNGEWLYDTYGVSYRRDLMCTTTRRCEGFVTRQDGYMYYDEWYYTVYQQVCMCRQGHYSLNPSGARSCIACAPGTYQDEVGSTSCKQCPDGSTSLPGQDHCECPSTSFVQSMDPIACSSCPDGSSINKQGGYIHVRYTSASSMGLVQFSASLRSSQFGETGVTFESIWPKASNQLQSPYEIFLSTSVPPSIASLPYSVSGQATTPFLAGGVCMCPAGKMFVVSPNMDSAECISCPVGFYCPSDARALNTNPFELYASLRGAVPLPYPLRDPRVSGTTSSRYAGGAVLCPGWEGLITDQAGALGRGARTVRECPCKLGAVRSSLSGICR